MVYLMKTVVVKVEIKVGDDVKLHRFVLGHGTTISFGEMKEKIRARIGHAYQSSFDLSYQDNEGERVELTADEDLDDALGIQKLNPLRIFVKLSEPDVDTKENTSEEVAPSTDVPPAPAEKPTIDAAKIAPAMVEEIFKNVRKLVKKSEDRAIDVAHLVDSVSAMLVNGINGPATDLLHGVLNNQHGFSQETKSSTPEATAAVQPNPAPEPEVGLNARGPESGGSKKVDMGKEPLPNEGGEDEFPARVFHSRVQCDGCGMLPIVGPRFKSTVKDDYDLCITCHGRADDKQNYSRIDRPLFKPRHALWGHRHMRRGCAPSGLFGGRPFVPAGPRAPPAPPTAPWMSGPYADSANARGSLPPVVDLACPRGPPPPLAPVCGPFADPERFRDLGAWGANFYSKLDSRFVCDVSIFDGTELSPGTHFTKIWRMRNNGNTNWPPGTSLAHIGGDTLSSVSSVTLPLPPQGVGVDEEYDIAVDAVAPQLPGRYVSHWRLVAPNGPKFGHRVWMLIQVVPKGEISPQEASLLKKAAEGEESPAHLQQQQQGGEDATAGEVLSEHEVAPMGDPLPAGGEFFGSSVTGSTSSSMLLVPPPPTPPTLEKGLSTEDVIKRVPTTDVAGILSEAAEYLSQVAAREGSSALESEAIAPIETGSQKAKSEAGSSKDDSADTKVAISKAETVAAEESEEGVSSPGKEEKVSEVNTSGSDTPTEKSIFGGFAILNAPTPPEGISYPEVIDHVASPPTTLTQEAVSKPLGESSQGAVEDAQSIAGVHATGLTLLKAMGYHDEVLNVELLEKNQGDIQATVDELVSAEEWDPMLEELEEMGFTDVETNRRLMFKNNGSVKQVVKELVEMYTSGSATLSK